MVTTLKNSETTFIQLPDLLLEFFLADMRSGKISANKLNTTDFVVYLLFLKTFNTKYQYSWISNETLAEKLGLEPRSISKSVAKLMKLGYIYRFKPSEAHRKENNGLHDSYCTRPLVRMLTSKEPIIDEREEYKDRILNAVRNNQKAADLRCKKTSGKHLPPLKDQAADDIDRSNSNGNDSYPDDDVPF
jgi:hypothetical protein